MYLTNIQKKYISIDRSAILYIYIYSVGHMSQNILQYKDPLRIYPRRERGGGGERRRGRREMGDEREGGVGETERERETRLFK